MFPGCDNRHQSTNRTAHFCEWHSGGSSLYPVCGSQPTRHAVSVNGAVGKKEEQYLMTSSIDSEHVVQSVFGIGTTEAGKQCSEPLRLPVGVLG